MTRRPAILPCLAACAVLAGCGQDTGPAASPSASATAVATTAAPATQASSAAPVGATDVQTAFGRVRIEAVTLADATHADAGILKVTYLDVKPLRVFPKAVEIGTFGTVANWRVDTRFSDYPVIVSEGGGTWQGYTCSWTALTELRPEGPVELASIQTHSDDEGVAVGAPQSTTGTIGSIDKNSGFTIDFTGSRTFSAVYKRSGNSYTLQSGTDNALRGC